MLRIPDANNAPNSNSTVDDTTDYDNYGWTEVNLYDTTDNLIGQGTDAQKEAASKTLGGTDNNGNEIVGWYIKMDHGSGEKVLSASTTVNNQIFITTYEPNPNFNGCVPLAGISRLYHIWAKDGQAVKNFDKTINNSNTELTKEDRVLLLKDPLPPDPQRMRVDGQDVVCVGADCLLQDTTTGVVETFWYQGED
jgi:type IV pilus assembly protein PilY1